MAEYNTGKLDSLFALDSLAAQQPVDSVRIQWDNLGADEQSEYGSFAEFKQFGSTPSISPNETDSILPPPNASTALNNMPSDTNAAAMAASSDLANLQGIREGKNIAKNSNQAFNNLAFKGFTLPPVSEELQTNLMPAVGIAASEIGFKVWTTTRNKLGEGGFFKRTGRANVGLAKNLLAYDLAMHTQGMLYKYLQGTEIEYGGKKIKFGEESYAPAIGSGLGAWGTYRGAKWSLGKGSDMAKNVFNLVKNNATMGRGAYLYDKAMTLAADDAVLKMTGRGPVPNYMYKQNVDRARAKAEKKIFRQLGQEMKKSQRDALKKILKNIGDNPMGKGMALGKYITKKSPWLGAKIISLAGLGAAGKLIPTWVTQSASVTLNWMLARDIFNLAMTDKTIQNILGLEVSDIPSQEQALIEQWTREEKFSLDPNDPFMQPGRQLGPQLQPPTE